MCLGVQPCQGLYCDVSSKATGKLAVSQNPLASPFYQAKLVLAGEETVYRLFNKAKPKGRIPQVIAPMRHTPFAASHTAVYMHHVALWH